MFRTCSRVVLMCTLLLTVGVPGQSAARASVVDGQGVLAWFDGQWIDLSEGWGGAAACSSDGVTATCYRSEAEMDRAATASTTSMAIVPLASCASSLRLYRSTSYGWGGSSAHHPRCVLEPFGVRIRQRHQQLQGRRVCFVLLRRRERRQPPLPGWHRRQRVGNVDVGRLGQSREQRLHRLTVAESARTRRRAVARRAAVGINRSRTAGVGATWRMRPRVSDLSPAWRGFVAAR